MSISWTDVTNIAPELATVLTSIQNDILADVDNEVDDGAWGIFADKGKKYLAAHLGTLTRPGTVGVSGPVASESLGPMARSYATSGVLSAGALSSTRYGAEYDRIRRIAIGFVGMVA